MLVRLIPKLSGENGTVYRRSDRYNPSNIGILEDYLYHQTRSEEYDCLANLAILKLYVALGDPTRDETQFLAFLRQDTSSIIPSTTQMS